MTDKNPRKQLTFATQLPKADIAGLFTGARATPHLVEVGEGFLPSIHQSTEWLASAASFW
jgi:hypothetical protein